MGLARNLRVRTQGGGRTFHEPCFIRSRCKWSNLFWHNALADQALLIAGLWLLYWQNTWVKQKAESSMASALFDPVRTDSR